MVHTAANILTEEQYLQIANDTVVSVISSNDTAEASVIQNVLFENVSPLYYNSRVRLSLSLKEEFKRHFILIKGLIEFYRPKNFSFEYNITQNAIETDVEVSEVSNLETFFDTILTWLKEEIKFKETLKTILDFEHRYKLEQAEVYALFKNTPAAK